MPIARETKARWRSWWGIAKSLVYVALGLGATTYLFSASFWFITHSTLEGLEAATLDTSAGVLLTAASLALFVFSSLIAMAGLVGWPRLKKYVKERVAKAIEPVKVELRGRSFSNAGYALGEISLGRDTFLVERRALLDSAVESCHLGFRALENATVGPRAMALNNWIYYMTFQERRAQDPDALNYARELDKLGRKENRHHLRLTYCRAVACYSENLEERSKAIRTVSKMIDKTPPFEKLGEYEVKEAESVRDLFLREGLPYKE